MKILYHPGKAKGSVKKRCNKEDACLVQTEKAERMKAEFRKPVLHSPSFNFRKPA